MPPEDATPTPDSATRLGARPIILTVSIAVVVAIVLAGAVTVGIATQKTPVPTAEPTSAPEQPDTTTIGADVDESPCSKFLDPATIAGALGGATDAQAFWGDPLLAVVGGLDCRFRFGETPSVANGHTMADDAAFVNFTVAPSAIIDPRELAASLRPVHCETNPAQSIPTTCDTMGVANGWWYTLSANSLASVSALRSSFDGIIDQLEDVLSGDAAPTSARVVKPFDCSSVDAGDAQVRSQRKPGFGGEIATAAFLLAGPVTCSFITVEGEEWSLEVYPDGAAAYPACTNTEGGSGSPISVPRVRFAFAHEPDDYQSVVCASDGTSAVRLSRNPAFGSQITAAIWGTAEERDALGALLAPVLSAARTSRTQFAAFSTPASSSPVPPLAGGDCRTLLDPAALAAIADGDQDAHVAPTDALLATLGGLGCDYTFGTQSYGVTGSVHVSVAPTVIAHPNQVKASLLAPQCPTQADITSRINEGCTAVVSIEGWWYSLDVSTDQTATAQEASFAAITAKLEAALKAAPAPESVNVAPAFDCTAVDPDAELVGRARGGDAGGWGAVSAAADLFGGPTICVYSTADEAVWQLTVYSGGAAAYQQCIVHNDLGGGTPGSTVSLAGVTSTFLHGYGDVALACATNGTSTIRAMRTNLDFSRPDGTWNDAARKTLGSLLVPVLAAAG